METPELPGQATPPSEISSVPEREPGVEADVAIRDSLHPTLQPRLIRSLVGPVQRVKSVGTLSGSLVFLLRIAI
jgi:hypothetical protein